MAAFPLPVRQRRAFVDTAAYFALLDRRDDFHEDAVATLRRIAVARYRQFTTNTVIIEAHALILNNLGIGQAAHLDTQELAQVKQQKCVAHLQRSVSEVLETKWGRGRSVSLGLRQVFGEATTLWHGYHAGTAVELAAQATGLQERLGAHLRERVLPDPDNQRLLDQLRWHHSRGNLLRFLDDPGIEPTNNRAERALRPAVIARKVSQCSKTPRGANAFAAFASVHRTTAQQGASGIAHLSELRRSPPPADR